MAEESDGAPKVAAVAGAAPEAVPAQPGKGGVFIFLPLGLLGVLLVLSAGALFYSTFSFFMLALGLVAAFGFVLLFFEKAAAPALVCLGVAIFAFRLHVEWFPDLYVISDFPWLRFIYLGAYHVVFLLAVISLVFTWATFSPTNRDVAWIIYFFYAGICLAVFFWVLPDGPQLSICGMWKGIFVWLWKWLHG